MLKIKRRNKSFLLAFEKTTNMSLVKGVGMIPYYFHLIYNYNSKILTYKNDKKYPFLKEYCKGLELEFLKKKRFNEKYNINISIIIYLIKNFKKIDILEVFWLRNSSVLYGIIYKMLNRKGILYLKLDAIKNIKNHNKIHPDGYKNYYYYNKQNFYNNLRNFIRIFMGKQGSRIFFKKLDIMSVETKEAFEDLKEYPKVKDKIIYLPNGIDDHLIKKLNVKTFEFSLKENIILTVGRIGWRAKKHEVLLEAIEKINDLKNWKIYLVGSIEESFKNYIDEYFKRNPNLKNTVIFTGEILERRKLFEFYQKSKIFCLTSRKESFGLVLVEAGYFGNYIVSTDLPSARDITLNGTLGTLFNIGDSEELAKNLEYLMENEKILKENAPKIQKHIEKNFLWRSIVSKLNDEIIKKRHYHDSI